MSKESLDAHSNRIVELREMVAQIASDIGIDAADLLQGEVDALGKRLENVRKSIETLADIAEARAFNENECKQNINKAKTYLNTMQQVSITPLYTCTCFEITILYPHISQNIEEGIKP